MGTTNIKRLAQFGATVLLAFVLGFVGAKWQDSKNLVSKELGIGTYHIPIKGQATPVTLQIEGDQVSGVREIYLDNGLSPGSCHLTYQLKGAFGAPSASMLTGSLEKWRAWTDVGLKGRILIEGRESGKPTVLVEGAWREWNKLTDDVIEIAGLRFRYNPASGDWESTQTP